MKHVLLPNTANRRLAFYLAMEEWVARTLPADNYFFTWIVDPTVICGRNQDISKEVDLDYCRANGIDVVRRRSGGGCVFADHNNIMISRITPETDVTTAFSAFTHRVAACLQNMGLRAEATGRNDIEIDGRKISGNAFYRLPGRSIAHGTMLYDTDSTHMSKAITPSRAKLESKKVQSVAKHIITARELLPNLSLHDFHRLLIGGLSGRASDGVITLTPEQITEIEALEQRYYDPKWLNVDVKTSHRKSVHIDGVGEFAVSVTLKDDNTIDNVNLTGDFFAIDDLDATILDRLKGVALTRTDISKALANTNISAVIPTLDNKTFISLLLGHCGAHAVSTCPQN